MKQQEWLSTQFLNFFGSSQFSVSIVEEKVHDHTPHLSIAYNFICNLLIRVRIFSVFFVNEGSESSAPRSNMN